MQCLSCLLFLVPSGAFARRPAKKGPEIIAHLSAQGVLATNLSLKRRDGRTYLYMYQPADKSLVVVDVTNAERPSVLHQIPGAGDGQVERVGAIEIVRVTEAGSPLTVDQSKFRFLDTRDPANPRSIPELDGATGTAIDSQRGYLFVSNQSGLWVVHDKEAVDPSVRAWWDFANAP